MDYTNCRLATPEEVVAFNRASAVAYREVTTGRVVNLCQGDLDMLAECREDFVLPEDFHSGLVDDFMSALAANGIDQTGFWEAKT